MHSAPPLFKTTFEVALERVLKAAASVAAVDRQSGGDDLPTDTPLALVDAITSTKRKVARDFFSAWESLFDLYNAEDNWDEGRPREVIPAYLMRMVGYLCGYLAVGEIPVLIKDVDGPGDKKRGPKERHDIRVAVSYVAAAKAGHISDKKSTKTITTAFGVNRRTVQDWCKTFPALEYKSVEKLLRLVDLAGSRYREAGRSASAIKSRRRASKTLAPNGSPIGLSYEEQEHLASVSRHAEGTQSSADLRSLLSSYANGQRATLQTAQAEKHSQWTEQERRELTRAALKEPQHNEINRRQKSATPKKLKATRHRRGFSADTKGDAPQRA